MGGAVDAPKVEEAAERYDIIHLNYTTNSLGLVGDLADACKRNRCKLVVNVDYAVDMWPSNIQHPSLFLRELDKADLVFHVEPRGAELLRMGLKREVPVIPHPIDTDSLIAWATKAEERAPMLNSVIHRYEMQVSEPWLLGKGLKDACGREDFTSGVSVCAKEVPEDMVSRFTYMFDWVRPQMQYSRWVQHLALSMIVFDSYNFSSFGRVVGECAALAVPCVGHTNCFAQRVLYPDLVFDRSDQDGKLNAMLALLNEPEYYKQTCRGAFKRVRKYFGYGPTRKTLLEHLGMEEEENASGDNSQADRGVEDSGRVSAA